MEGLLLIRQAVWDDVPCIKQVAKTHKYISHFSHPAYCNRTKFNNGEIIVAVNNAAMIVGFVVLRIRKREPRTDIDIIGVLPDYRGRGVGKQIIDYVCSNQRNPV